MAEFQEVQRHIARMCSSLKCAECPLSNDNNGYRLPCGKFSQQHPDKSESIIIAWVNENPPPKYPTWYQLLVRYNVIPYACSDILISEAIRTEIPVELANELGIRPIDS